jgi:hypothetical protein
MHFDCSNRASAKTNVSYVWRTVVLKIRCYRGYGVKVFNVTFSNILALSRRSVLLVEETGENHRPVASHSQTLSQNAVWSTPRYERESNAQR